jgi:hypothetical protein
MSTRLEQIHRLASSLLYPFLLALHGRWRLLRRNRLRHTSRLPTRLLKLPRKRRLALPLHGFLRALSVLGFFLLLQGHLLLLHQRKLEELRLLHLLLEPLAATARLGDLFFDTLGSWS